MFQRLDKVRTVLHLVIKMVVSVLSSEDVFCLAFAQVVNRDFPSFRHTVDIMAPAPLHAYASLKQKIESKELNRHSVISKFIGYMDDKFHPMVYIAEVFDGGYDGVVDPFMRLFTPEWQDKTLYYLRSPHLLADKEIEVISIDIPY